jgi:hypothetical protein
VVIVVVFVTGVFVVMTAGVSVAMRVWVRVLV